MDENGSDVDELIQKPLVNQYSRDEDHTDEGSCFSDTNSSLPPRRGGISRNSDKLPRKVQWNDNVGNKLVEVLVFQPSDVSELDEGHSDSCLCSMM